MRGVAVYSDLTSAQKTILNRLAATGGCVLNLSQDLITIRSLEKVGFIVAGDVDGNEARTFYLSPRGERVLTTACEYWRGE